MAPFKANLRSGEVHDLAKIASGCNERLIKRSRGFSDAESLRGRLRPLRSLHARTVITDNSSEEKVETRMRRKWGGKNPKFLIQTGRAGSSCTASPTWRRSRFAEHRSDGVSKPGLGLGNPQRTGARPP